MCIEFEDFCFYVHRAGVHIPDMIVLKFCTIEKFCFSDHCYRILFFRNLVSFSCNNFCMLVKHENLFYYNSQISFLYDSSSTLFLILYLRLLSSNFTFRCVKHYLTFEIPVVSPIKITLQYLVVIC